MGLIGGRQLADKCNPPVNLLPLKKNNFFNRIRYALFYHSGRIVTYGLLGLFFGMFGRGLRLAGLQPLTTILFGSALVVSALYPIISKERIRIEDLFAGFSARLNASLVEKTSNLSFSSHFMIGFQCGFMPFGLLFVAIAGSISAGDVWNGTLFMILFAIGNIPAFLKKNRNSGIVAPDKKPKNQKVIPYFIFLFGLLLILRGISPGIPYLSLSDEKPVPKTITAKGKCCD